LYRNGQFCGFVGSSGPSQLIKADGEVSFGGGAGGCASTLSEGEETRQDWLWLANAIGSTEVVVNNSTWYSPR